MTYPIPIQVHVMWHPASDAVCRPLAEKLYVALNRDAYQPLVPGIGIPVFFRCIGADPAAPASVPARIVVPDTEYDLRVALLTPKFALDKVWKKYLAENYSDVAGMRDRATLLAIALGPNLADSDEKAVVLDPASERVGEQILQHVLLQACRLIAQRPRGTGGGNLGAAPLRLFISHTKRDKLGLQIAQAVKKYLDGMAVDRFFDEVSIQPGDSISDELRQSIDDSALVAIRTDGYVSSPWCRMEVALAKRARRPMVVLDALVDKESRSSPFLVNLPSIRVAADTIAADAQLERVANFLGLEILRFLHAQLQLQLLQKQGLVNDRAILLPRQPEPRDLFGVLEKSELAPATSLVFVHPDPVLSAEESEEYSAYKATFTTPTSVWSKKLDDLQLGISVSSGDADEARRLGLSGLHLEDAARVIARQALAAGATLVYGGALGTGPGQFAEALFEMIGAYNKGGYFRVPPLINYAAWPWSEEVDDEWLVSRQKMLEAIPWPLPSDVPKPDAGEGPGKVARIAATPEGRYVLARSLSHMRAEITRRTHARVVLGGRSHTFMGVMPGIVEEVLLAVRSKQPLYVLGGFGGAAALVTRALLGEKPEQLTLEFQQRASPDYAGFVSAYERERAEHPELNLHPVDYAAIVHELAAYGPAGVARANFLSETENQELFTTGSIDSGLFLLMKGLSAIRPQQ